MSRSGPQAIKLFLCSPQLSMEFQMLIISKMLKNKDFSCFQLLRGNTHRIFKRQAKALIYAYAHAGL